MLPAERISAVFFETHLKGTLMFFPEAYVVRLRRRGGGGQHQNRAYHIYLTTSAEIRRNLKTGVYR